VCSTWFKSNVQKIQKKKKNHPIFINFIVKKFTLKNTQCYDFLDPMNEELKNFEVDFQQNNFKILWLFP
jgi:hypothetical protein